MKLTKVRITEFQSIQDSTEFEIGDVTCLVGKNEAGKTAVLKALYRLLPINDTDGVFDATDHFPRRRLIDYDEDVADGNRDPATVVKATFTLESGDVSAITEVFGPDCLVAAAPSITLSKGYSKRLSFSSIAVNEEAAIRHCIKASDLPQQLAAKLGTLSKPAEMVGAINEESEQSQAASSLADLLSQITDQGVAVYIYRKLLSARVPKFFYFDEYYQMLGQVNLEELIQRRDSDALEDSDRPLMGLLEIAGLDIDDLINPGRTERLFARLESAANGLTSRALKYWSQNRHIRMKFEIQPGQPNDPDGMREGTNIWGRVEDTKHSVTTSLGTRSRGFVWFFSFLAWYSKLRREHQNLILLLDEPGLSLHAKAQADLLRYFEEELKPHHQLIYTTHSPFMVDPGHFDRVRIVQDLSIEAESDDLPEDQQGTKVLTDVLDATQDSLFPLQGALGYEIHQSLFIGPNCLIVEGASDLLYIQTMSALLQSRGRRGLNSQWTITPVGGANNVPTFVALIGARSNLNVAVLIDFQKKDQQFVQNLYKSKLLKKQNVLTFSDYVKGSEADIEDMFDPELYLKLVNSEFNSSLGLSDLPMTGPRILQRLEQHLESTPLSGGVPFNHYRPARYCSENIGSLGAELSDATLDRFQQAFDDLNQLL